MTDSANPRSPESGDVPEWVADAIQRASRWMEDMRTTNERVILYLTAELSTARERADRAEQENARLLNELSTVRDTLFIADPTCCVAEAERLDREVLTPTPTPDHA